jgi:hypothetical protein
MLFAIKQNKELETPPQQNEGLETPPLEILLCSMYRVKEKKRLKYFDMK